MTSHRNCDCCGCSGASETWRSTHGAVRHLCVSCLQLLDPDHFKYVSREK